MEAKLLRYLAERMGEVVPHGELLLHVWGYSQHTRTRTLYSTVYRLRAALEPDPTAPIHLVTVAGRGLKLIAAGTLAARTTNLAPLDEVLVGREELLAQLESARSGALTVVGPGGVGKTRLVVEHAWRRFGAGTPAWFCDLAAAVTPADVGLKLAAALSLVVGDPVADLGPTLAARGPLLLVLDGADGVDDLGPVLLGWAREAPDARWLVTRRVPFGSEGEHRLRVGPLELPGPERFDGPAVELLLRRIRAAEPSFDPAGAEAELGELLALTDGLPLALEIAAPHVAAIGPAAVVDALRTGASLGDTGQRSVRAVIGWSWDRLSEPSRAAVAQLAAFARSFSIAVAARVVEVPAGGSPLARIVSELVESGLVMRAPASRQPRFTLLSALRSFVGTPDPAAVERHLAVYLDLARQRFAAADGLLADDGYDSEEADEALHAATHALPSVGDPALAELFEFTVRTAVRAGRSEAAETLARAVFAADAAPRTRVRLSAWWAERLASAGRSDDARALWLRLPAEASREGLPELAAEIELTAGRDLFTGGQEKAAAACADRAERWAREIRAPSPRLAAYFRGRVAQLRAAGAVEPAGLPLRELAVHELLVAGRPEALALARYQLALGLLRVKRSDDALRQAETGVAEAPAHLPIARAELLGMAARALLRGSRTLDHQSRVEQAFGWADEACRIVEREHLPASLPSMLVDRGWCHLELGELDLAREDALRALQIATRTGQVRLALSARALRATVAAIAVEPDLDEQLSAAFDATFGGRMWGAAGSLAVYAANAWADGRARDPLRLTALLLQQEDLDHAEHDVALLHAELLRSRGRPQAALATLREVEGRGRGLVASLLRVSRAALAAELGDTEEALRIIRHEPLGGQLPWAALFRARCARALALPDEVAAAIVHIRPRSWESLLRQALAELTPDSD